MTLDCHCHYGSRCVYHYELSGDVEDREDDHDHDREDVRSQYISTAYLCGREDGGDDREDDGNFYWTDTFGKEHTVPRLNTKKLQGTYREWLENKQRSKAVANSHCCDKEDHDPEDGKDERKKLNGNYQNWLKNKIAVNKAVIEKEDGDPDGEEIIEDPEEGTDEKVYKEEREKNCDGDSEEFDGDPGDPEPDSNTVVYLHEKSPWERGEHKDTDHHEDMYKDVDETPVLNGDSGDDIKKDTDSDNGSGYDGCQYTRNTDWSPGGEQTYHTEGGSDNRRGGDDAYRDGYKIPAIDGPHTGLVYILHKDFPWERGRVHPL